MVKKGLGKTDEIIKKWMLYLVLFLASLVVVVDLVILVRYFVEGEVTNRFIFKVLITLGVALFAGCQYLRELGNWPTRKYTQTVFAAATVLIAGLAIWCSFIVMGSPAAQRQYRLDDRRVQDLQSIQSQVIYFWQQKQKLPDTLATLSNPISGYSLPVDPEFQKGVAYEYKKKTDLSFELCAIFARPLPQGWQEYSKGGVVPMMAPAYPASDSISSYPYPGGSMNESWDHQAGRTCFTRTIDKDLYPPFPKPAKAY